jgi:hypothetical protein
MGAHKSELLKYLQVTIKEDGSLVLSFLNVWPASMSYRKITDLKKLYFSTSHEELVELIKKYAPEKLI